ncbi:PREDICTED: NAD-dependent protein deacetylase Sirt6 isoform X2 [Wasmannia auropunctata]|uniref:NAD-dependent protein deacetylase Sirt6 isoform X2 n=1 Tax=Wasmannia auropunctata TaxID=64793 RepID=UPI0005EF9564|nr:PREDICTED: NAD-dependent protein deacetylase Sirt6 isoform X2 [Wasmannia auropunctata]
MNCTPVRTPVSPLPVIPLSTLTSASSEDCGPMYIGIHLEGETHERSFEDFKGTNGVWTLEQKGLKPSMNISFDEAIPTKTHMALKKLIEAKKIKFIISQNIDGLHLRSGISRQYLAELHGNMFTEQCDKCGRQFIRNFATKSVGKKSLDTVCRSEQIGGRPCRGRMHDTILDWEHNLPDSDLTLSDLHSSVADLSICLGTTLQIIPSGNLPLYTKKYGGRLVICNLQQTKHDKKADLIINGNVDEIMVAVMKKLGLEIAEYESSMDPTRNSDTTAKEMDWTIPTSRVKEMNVLYKKVCKPMRRKRKTFMYERERTDTAAKKDPKARKQAFTVKQEIKTEDNITTSGEMCKTENDRVTDDSVKTEENAEDVEMCRYSMEDATEHNTDLKMNQTV